MSPTRSPREPLVPDPPRGFRQGRRREDDGRRHAREARRGLGPHVLLVSTDGRGDAGRRSSKARNAGYQRGGAGPASARPSPRTSTRSSRTSWAPCRRSSARGPAPRAPGLPLLHAGDAGAARPPPPGEDPRDLQTEEAARGEPRVDLIVLDAPATGHALSLLALPRTLLATVPAGPVRKLAVTSTRSSPIRSPTPRSSSSPSRPSSRPRRPRSSSRAPKAPRASRRRSSS